MIFLEKCQGGGGLFRLFNNCDKCRKPAFWKGNGSFRSFCKQKQHFSTRSLSPSLALFLQSRIPGLRNQWDPVSHYLDSYIILSYFGFIYFFSYFGVIYFNLMTILPKKTPAICNMPRTSDVTIQNTLKTEIKKVSAQYGLTLSTNSKKKEPKFTSLGIFLKISKVKSAKTFSFQYCHFREHF